MAACLPHQIPAPGFFFSLVPTRLDGPEHNGHKTAVRLLGSSNGTANPERTRHPAATLLAHHGRQPGRGQPATVRGLRAVLACGLRAVSEQMLSASVNGRCRCPPLHRPTPVAMRALHCDRLPSTCDAHPLQVFKPRGAPSGVTGSAEPASVPAVTPTTCEGPPPSAVSATKVCVCAVDIASAPCPSDCTRHCIVAGNARGARAFLGPPVCTSVVLRNLSDLVEVQTPRNSRLRSIISMISIVGNARDPRAFPSTSWQNCARVARICDESVDHSPGAAPSVGDLQTETRAGRARLLVLVG